MGDLSFPHELSIITITAKTVRLLADTVVIAESILPSHEKKQEAQLLIAEGPRDAQSQLKSCQMLHSYAENRV